MFETCIGTNKIESKLLKMWRELKIISDIDFLNSVEMNTSPIRYKLKKDTTDSNYYGNRSNNTVDGQVKYSSFANSAYSS